jgi:tetratricopeptide (TPR) repeat protein
MLKIFLRSGLIVLSVLTAACCFAADEADQVTGFNEQETPLPVTRNVQPQRKKPTADQYYYAGEKYYEAFKYDAAIKFYYYALKLDKNYLAAWKKLAFCYYKLNKHKNAYAAFKKVLEFDREDKDALEFMQYYSNIMEKTKKQKQKREVLDSVWRAAVLPGWGQFYNNQIMKGIIISGGMIVAGGLTAYSVVDQHAKYDKYLKTNENHDIAYKEAESAWNTALIWTIVTAVIYAGGVADAALNYDCVEARLLEARINNDGGLILCANVRW